MTSSMPLLLQNQTVFLSSWCNAKDLALIATATFA
jgi:hypothetical protein